MKIANILLLLHGNPNVGKSTIFNSLTGMKQHTGNWPGKTVENTSGNCLYNGENYLLVDIPGTYSIMSHSEEEEIARDYICFEELDATVVITDATCLERNLNLVYQIMEITPRVILCVNLLDEAKKKGIKIDLEQLEKKLNIPVVGTIAKKKKTLKNLMKQVEFVSKKRFNNQPNTVYYGETVEKCIEMLNEEIEPMLLEKQRNLARWICLKLLDGEEKILSSIENNLKINLTQNNVINKKIQKVDEVLQNANIKRENIKDFIIYSIVSQAENVSKEVITKEEGKGDRGRKIDKILTSKTFGIPIMIVFLGIILWITITDVITTIWVGTR